jgi:hypothetical protein
MADTVATGLSCTFRNPINEPGKVVGSRGGTARLGSRKGDRKVPERSSRRGMCERTALPPRRQSAGKGT